MQITFQELVDVAKRTLSGPRRTFQAAIQNDRSGLLSIGVGYRAV